MPLAETLGALCGLAREGKALAVGVINFSVPLLRETESLASIPLACDQVSYILTFHRKTCSSWNRWRGDAGGKDGRYRPFFSWSPG